jgi:hypothetical protein
MATADIQVREGITFEWLDAPSVPNRRWRARMSREVFAELVKQKLKISPDVPARAPQFVPKKRPSFLASQQPTKS